MTKIAIFRRYFVVINSWLERMGVVKTFDDDVLEKDIQEITKHNR